MLRIFGHFVPVPALALGLCEAILLAAAFYLVNAPIDAFHLRLAPMPAQVSLGIALIAVLVDDRGRALSPRRVPRQPPDGDQDRRGAAAGGARGRRGRRPLLRPAAHRRARRAGSMWCLEGEPRLDGVGPADAHAVPALSPTAISSAARSSSSAPACAPAASPISSRRGDQPLLRGQGLRPCLRRSARRHGRAARSRPHRGRPCARRATRARSARARSSSRPTSAAACRCCSSCIARSPAST